VACPVLGRIALVPLKPVHVREELGTDAHAVSIRLSYTVWAIEPNKSVLSA
jgi:hypothetical protein